MKKIFFTLSLLILASGCVKEPEGPAEQIGKGIDQVSKGVRQYEYETRDRRAPTPTPVPSLRDSWRSDPDTYSDDSSSNQWESYEEWRKRKGYN